jgi:MarC family membrane protein
MPGFPASRFALLAFSSLFSVINPVSAAPIFVAMTEGWDRAARRRAAWRASLASAATLFVFAAAGGAIFAFFGITVPAFQIAGGILFTVMSLKTLDEGREEVPKAEAGDPSIVPLGIPLIAGPGAISTVMVLVGQADSGLHRAALAGAIGLNILLTLVTFLLAPTVVSLIGVTGQKIVGKIMGIITVVIGVQFVINGATAVLLEIFRASRSS